MTILKWYSIALVVLTTVHSLYTSGKENENILIVMTALILEMPILIYLILS